MNDPMDGWWESATGNIDDAADQIEQARIHAQWVADGAGAPMGVRRASKALDDALRSAWDAMVEVRRACSRERRAELETLGEVRHG